MTLIELLTVVAIVAIISAIAVPSYRNYVIRANRSEAKMALLRVQVAQEKFFLQNNRYATDDELDDAPPAGLGIPTTTPKGNYTIDINPQTNSSYTARARAANSQLGDISACQTLTINESGVKSPDESSGCWK